MTISFLLKGIFSQISTDTWGVAFLDLAGLLELDPRPETMDHDDGEIRGRLQCRGLWWRRITQQRGG